MSWSRVPQVVTIASTIPSLTMSTSTPLTPVATIAAGNERNFVHPSRSFIDFRVLATSNMLLAMKPPPFPIRSTRVAMSSDSSAWKSRTRRRPGIRLILACAFGYGF